jgi:hypothetical protein
LKNKENSNKTREPTLTKQQEVYYKENGPQGILYCLQNCLHLALHAQNLPPPNIITQLMVVNEQHPAYSNFMKSITQKKRKHMKY